MQTTRLGNTDLTVSRICFGTWQLSPRFWGDIPLNEWREAVQTALGLGINFFDTADAYGDGFSEEQLGKVLNETGSRDRVVLATKFFWNLEGPERYPNTRADYLTRACEASLRRLGTDRIDLYQIHAWDALIRPDEVAEAFAKLHKAGKVRWFGVSNWNARQMALGRRHFPLATLQPKYNLLHREVEKEIFPYCQEHNIGTLVYSPLERGLLGGLYTPGQTFADSRGKNPQFQGKRFESLLAGLEQLRPLAAECGLTIAQFTLRWVLTHPGVSCAILGVKAARHLDASPAADGVLPQDVWHRAAEIMQEANQPPSV